MLRRKRVSDSLDQDVRDHIDEIRQDVRSALRMLRRYPAFALIVVVTLALGVGANTAMFAVVNAVLLRSLPYQNADRLVQLAEISPGAEGTAPRRSRPANRLIRAA